MHRQTPALSTIQFKNVYFKYDQGSEYILERGAGYSGGQRQKIAIAGAILSNKGVIVFDEATSALDLESEEVICGYLQKEARKGKIIIIVSHRESVNAICNRVFQVENGKVCELRNGHSAC